MKISVIVPTYNRNVKLVETIGRIENNPFPKKQFEIIIIDDASTDNTEEIVQDLIKKYRNIKYIKNTKNLGPASSRNKGIKLSRGEYIFFTDDDCLVPKTWLSEYLSFFNKHKELGGIGGILQPYSNNAVAKIEIFKDKILKIRRTKPLIGGKEVPIGFTNNVAYKREVFKKVGYFSEKFKVPAGEDVEFKTRVAKKYDLAFLPIKVIHNHNYNLDYLFGITIKQGLEKTPPKFVWQKVLMLIIYSPLLIFNIIKKVISYRKR